MNSSKWIAAGALLVALGVGLGAFGAHALKDRLVEAGQLDNWKTAVDYHVWHGLASILYGIHTRHAKSTAFIGWAFCLGVPLFSGSIYGLCLGGPSWLGPITPLGGSLWIAAWIAFAVSAGRRSEPA